MYGQDEYLFVVLVDINAAAVLPDTCLTSSQSPGRDGCCRALGSVVLKAWLELKIRYGG